jgi:hypothetical protein
MKIHIGILLNFLEKELYIKSIVCFCLRYESVEE